MQDAQSPFGIPWVYVGFVVATLTLLVLIVVAVRHSRALLSVAGVLLIAACLGASAWTSLTVTRDVSVPIAEDPDGATCLSDPFGENPDLSIDWGDECGHAFASHLVWSIGPSVLMLVVVTSVAARSKLAMRTD